MNTKKAGEDFYFLNKMALLGSFHEINEATIYPSARQSDRVPFGTGHAIEKIKQGTDQSFYNPQSYQDLKVLFNSVKSLYNREEPLLPSSIERFHQEHDFEEDLAKILKNAASVQVFEKSFFRWWDGFRLLKFMHFARDHFYESISEKEALDALNNLYWKIPTIEGLSKIEQLGKVRAIDRDYTFPSNLLC